MDRYSLARCTYMFARSYVPSQYIVLVFHVSAPSTTSLQDSQNTSLRDHLPSLYSISTPDIRPQHLLLLIGLPRPLY